MKKMDSVELSARDSARVREVLENPPKPTEKLLAAAKALAGKHAKEA